MKLKIEYYDAGTEIYTCKDSAGNLYLISAMLDVMFELLDEKQDRKSLVGRTIEVGGLEPVIYEYEITSAQLLPYEAKE